MAHTFKQITNKLFKKAYFWGLGEISKFPIVEHYSL